MYVCMYVCMYACVRACVYICMYVCMYVLFMYGGGVLMMGASATQLSKLDRMQHFAEQLCSTQLILLERHRYAAAIGLLCKLLDGICCEHLQRFYPSFQSSISLAWRSQCLNISRPFLLVSSITTTSLP